MICTTLRRAAIAAALAVLAAAAGAAEAQAPAIPTSAFANLPMVQQVALSPDGLRFAALVNSRDQTYLATREIDQAGASLKALLKSDNRKFRFNWIRWVNNERLLVSLRYPGQRGFTETTETRLISIRKDGSDIVSLVRRPPHGESWRTAQLQDQVIDWMPEDGHHVLLQLPDDEDPDRMSLAVYRVDVDTGIRSQVQWARPDVKRWYTDRTHQVRVALRQDGTHVQVQITDPGQTEWRTAWSYELFDRSAVTPLGFGDDPNLLYIQADHEGRDAVFEVDLRDPKLARRLLLSDRHVDLDGELILAPGSGKAIGIRGGIFGDAAASFWDADAQRLVRAIDRGLPDRANWLLQFSADGSRYLLYSSGNGIAPEYYIGNRKTGEVALLAETYPELPPERLVKKRRLEIAARDGRPLPAFLTLPPGADAKGLPAVILPHGGPISNDNADFDPWVQFLAQRGYAVLQVNFRGSGGYGIEHRNAGLKRWGLEMQDDLSDAVVWLTQQGIADAKRVCIVGASYGGYAALMGAVKTPELYRCVASFAGVSDLLASIDYESDFVNGREVLERMVGSAWDDRDQLKATSPRRWAEKVQAPVLLVHGTADRTVPLEQSELMADALKSAGKRVRFVTQQDGDHQLSSQAQRLQFFEELERFLAENLRPTAAQP